MLRRFQPFEKSKRLDYPRSLRRLLEERQWPRCDSEARRMVTCPVFPPEAVRLIDPYGDRIELQSPPFPSVAECTLTNPAFWNDYGSLDQIEPAQCYILGDFGLGSDSPIILEFLSVDVEPRVLRLDWSLADRENPNRTQWIEIASDLDELARKLSFGARDWDRLRPSVWTRAKERWRFQRARRTSRRQRVSLEDGPGT